MVFFGYTRCARLCAFTVDNFQLVMDELGTAAEAVTAYFITVDPQRDTRAVLAEYVRGMSERIRALTGTDEQVDAALAAFGVRREVQAAQADGGYAVHHPGVLFFLGRDGRYKLHFREGTPAYEMTNLIRARIGSPDALLLGGTGDVGQGNLTAAERAAHAPPGARHGDASPAWRRPWYLPTA
ncbi:MAG: SCO family protein [Alphaproteobacteria bacterium]|nr:SCO family protein [Alphaproteobacteria bacterium]